MRKPLQIRFQKHETQCAPPRNQGKLFLEIRFQKREPQCAGVRNS
jgi:hypothetical protein